MQPKSSASGSISSRFLSRSIKGHVNTHVSLRLLYLLLNLKQKQAGGSLRKLHGVSRFGMVEFGAVAGGMSYRIKGNRIKRWEKNSNEEQRVKQKF